MHTPKNIRALSSLETLTGKELAELQEYLISVEEQPGGPYFVSSDVTENSEFNAKVYQLYKQQGIELAGALHYASTYAAIDPEPSTQKQSAAPVDSSSFYLLTSTLPHVLPNTARKKITPLLSSLEKTDSRGEISRLSERFAECLSPLYRKNKSVRALATANLYAWAAYSLYDTLIDEEGDPTFMNIANILSRESQRIYGTHPKVYSLFTRVDTAMLTELSTRTALDYTQESITLHTPPSGSLLAKLLSERSIVHILGPLLLVKCSEEEMHQLEQALAYYCAARQLLDDIHDWQEDLLEGRYTYVIHQLVQSASLKIAIPYPTHTYLPKLQALFWEQELPKLLRKAISFANTSEKLLKKLPLFKQIAPFTSLTTGHIKENATAALQRYSQEKEYLRTIRSRQEGGK